MQSDQGEEDRDKEEEDEMEEDVSSEKDHGENEDQDKGDEPSSRLVCVSPVLPSSDSDSDSLGGQDQEDRTRMWVGRLPEMTRLRRAGPVNDFVDNDPLK